MNARLISYLPHTDELWKCGGTIELVSSSINTDLTGVGASPYGDMAVTGVSVPSAPVDKDHRYLIRLVGVEIPKGFVITIKGLRQAATLRSVVAQEDGSSLVIEREIVSPFWRFMDGNISWHLRYTKNVFTNRLYDTTQAPGTSPGLGKGYDSALLYLPPLVPYTPPNGGQPPGDGIEDLGSFNDLRYPWEETSWTMEQLISGPGSVILYASVKQTDPTGRPAYPTTCEGLRPEDQFVSNFPDAIYGRVAGAMTVELLPCRKGE